MELDSLCQEEHLALRMTVMGVGEVGWFDFEG
jgi:hypothetical protein